MRALALSSLQQKERHLAEAQNRLAAGVATDQDLLAAQVSTENARPELIRSENRIRTAKPGAGALPGGDRRGEIDVAGSLEIAPAEIASAQNTPKVELAGGMGWHRLEAAGRSWDGAAYDIGVHLSVPFFDGFKTAGKVQQARSDLRTRKLEETQQLDSVSLEVRNAGFAVAEAEQILKALTGTVKQAERLLAMAEQGYQLGVKIRLEVEDAELNLVQARSNLARARRDYPVSQTRPRLGHRGPGRAPQSGSLIRKGTAFFVIAAGVLVSHRNFIIDQAARN